MKHTPTNLGGQS